MRFGVGVVAAAIELPLAEKALPAAYGEGNNDSISDVDLVPIDGGPSARAP
jgi:hypothetical protein